MKSIYNDKTKVNIDSINNKFIILYLYEILGSTTAYKISEIRYPIMVKKPIIVNTAIIIG